jgi:hypothetical protein
MLEKLTDQDIMRYLNHKAYGMAVPDDSSFPILARSSTLQYHKKAISYYMPQKRVVWDEIRKEGNPTKSKSVNEMINKVQKHEVQGEGVESQARRALEWDEYINILIAAQ